MMSKKRRFSFMLTAVASLSLSLTASAAPTAQIISANAVGACVSSGGTPHYAWDGFYNDSPTQNMYLECSLPMATASANGVGTSSTFRVFGHNRSVSENLTCGFKAVTSVGFVVYETNDQKAFMKTIAPNTSGGSMLFNMGGLNLQSPVYASCSIPKKQGASGRSGLTGMWFQYLVDPD